MSCPSVNEVFDAGRVSPIYGKDARIRQQLNRENRATDYSVVRPELLDSRYTKMYVQRFHVLIESRWKHRIFGPSELISADEEDEISSQVSMDGSYGLVAKGN